MKSCWTKVGFWTIPFLLLTWSVPVSGQERRREGRELVEGLLRALINSQLDRGGPPERQPPARVPPQLVQTRETLRSFSQQMGVLTRDLGAIPQTAQARRWMSSALQVNASSTRLATYSQRVGATADLQNGIRNLDREWRLLSHHLRQVDGLPANCRRVIDQLDQLDSRLCQLCDIEPQLDYSQLTWVSAAIDTSLVRLIEDIEVELGRSPRCAPLVVEGGRVLQECRGFAAEVQRRGRLAALTGQLQTVYPAWQAFATNVNSIGNRFLERDVRRIDEKLVTLHELLWLPVPMDYGRLAHLTDVLTQDVNQLFEAVSLNVLLNLRRPDGVLETAGAFFGLCENFSDAVEARASMPELRQEFQYLVRGWPELANCFRRSRRTEVVRSLASIEESFVALQTALGVAPQVDWHAAAEQAAACERLARQLNSQLRKYIVRNSRYDAAFRRRVEQGAAQFQRAANQLHQQLVSRRDDRLHARCSELADAWTTLNSECLGNLEAGDRRYIVGFPQRITESVVSLQALLLVGS